MINPIQKGHTMKRFMILILALVIISLSASAQDLIPPPVGYLDSCGGNAFMLEHFGPNCLNPVFWDLGGMPRIGTWLNYVREDGVNSSGVLLGFSWQFHEQRYYYYVMRQLSNSIFPFSFEAIAPDRVIQ